MSSARLHFTSSFEIIDTIDTDIEHRRSAFILTWTTL